jgi:hypothetical protein
MFLNLPSPLIIRVLVFHRSDHCRADICIGILGKIYILYMRPASRYLRYHAALQRF